MIPLPSFAAVRLGALVAVIAGAGFAGWTVRGWKADAAINGLRATISQSVAKAVSEARTVERKEQEIVNEALRTQNDSLAGIAAGLRHDIERLRQRPERPTVAAGVPTAPRPDCAGATGAELSRTDAEFLVREAARADDIRAGLVACYQVIDGIQ